MQIYLVGGAVRDQLLNIPNKDKDWVVTGSTPDEMLELGYEQVGQDFPVFLHPKTKDEYALARTERKSGHGYQGFSFDTSSKVTLEEDLSRRDLTINAMALSESGDLIDPFNGKQDLENKLLRHVSEAFVEDPLRVLRVARFAARFYSLGFVIADETISLMQEIARSGELSHLTPERVWQETQRALGESSAWIYFQTLNDCNALEVIFPELYALFGVPQPPKHHPEIDTGVHSLMSLESACKLSTQPKTRFCSLIHDLGKGETPTENWPSHHGHEKLGLKPIKKLCTRLKTPSEYKELSLLVSEYHTHIHKAFELTSKTILKVLKRCDAYRRPERFHELLVCCKADARGRTGFENTPYPQADFFKEICDETSKLSVQDLMKQGFQGKELGLQLDRKRLELIDQLKQSLRPPS